MAAVNAEDSDDIEAITSSPSFFLLTTLRYIFFHHQDEQDAANSEIYDLIRQWKAINMRLLELHCWRLQEAAQALEWLDSSWPHLDSKTLQSRIEAFAMDAEKSQNGQGSISPLKPGHMRSRRTRVLVSRHGAIRVEFGPVDDNSLTVDALTHQIRNYTCNPFTSTQTVSPTSSPVSHVTLDTAPSTPHACFTVHKTTHRSTYDAARTRAELSPTAVPMAREVLLFNPACEIMEASLSSVYFQRDGQWVTPAAECGGLKSVTRLYALEKGWCKEGVVRKEDVRVGEQIWLSNAVRGFFPGEVR